MVIFNMDYSEKQLKKIENDILSGIDKDINKEKELDEMAMEVAKKLISNKYCNYKFLDTDYKIGYMKDQFSKSENAYGIQIVVYDVLKLKIANLNYHPLIAFIAYDDKHSEEELLGTVIKAVFKHKLGEDVLVEEDDVQQ